MSVLKVDRTLAALKATVDWKVNCHCWQDFGSSESYSRQECQLPLLTGFSWLQNATLPTPIVYGNHCVFQVLGSSESYRNFSSYSWQDFWKLQSTGLSTTTNDEILVALNAIVDRNFNSHRWQDSGSSESYGYGVKKVEDSPEKEMLNIAEPYFSYCSGPTCEEE